MSTVTLSEWKTVVSYQTIKTAEKRFAGTVDWALQYQVANGSGAAVFRKPVISGLLCGLSWICVLKITMEIMKRASYNVYYVKYIIYMTITNSGDFSQFKINFES